MKFWSFDLSKRDHKIVIVWCEFFIKLEQISV